MGNAFGSGRPSGSPNRSAQKSRVMLTNRSTWVSFFFPPSHRPKSDAPRTSDFVFLRATVGAQFQIADSLQMHRPRRCPVSWKKTGGVRRGLVVYGTLPHYSQIQPFRQPLHPCPQGLGCIV